MDNTARTSLDACARLMSVGAENRELDLYNLGRVFRREKDACIAYLKEAVEWLSAQTYTVREYNPELLGDSTLIVEGNLYVVFCPSVIPLGIVKTKIGIPYLISPMYGTGCAQVSFT
jgi:hypothetical protein